MITIRYYIVLEIEQDEYGYIAPVFVDLDELNDEYPGAEYIEIEVTKFDINNN